MRSSLLARLPFAAAFGIVIGCSTAPSSTSVPTSSSRVLTGSIRTAAYALDNAVAMAVSSDGRRFVGAVQVDGSFRVTVPTGSAYRLALANTRAAGGFEAIAAISWTSAARTAWMHLDGAGELPLGVVRPSTSLGLTTESQGSGGGGSDDGSDAGSGGKGGGGDDKGSGGDAHADGGDDDDDDDTQECRHGKGAEADLPYDVQPQVGSTFHLSEAFLFKGPLPAALLGVTMDSGSTWRLVELQDDAPFVITQADCDHVGNRDVGRDRIEVTWQNADGSTKTDHLDLRYCDPSGSRATPPTAPAPVVTVNNDCEDDDQPTCASGAEIPSECDGDHGMGTHADTGDDGADDDRGTTCPAAPPSGGGSGVSPSPNPPSGGGSGAGGGSGSSSGGAAPPSGGGSGVAPSPSPSPSPTPPAGGGAGGACNVNADCATGLACIASVCATRPIP